MNLRVLRGSNPQRSQPRCRHTLPTYLCRAFPGYMTIRGLTVEAGVRLSPRQPAELALAGLFLSYVRAWINQNTIVGPPYIGSANASS